MFPVMFALSRATVLFISYLSWEAAPFLVLWLKSRLLLGLFFLPCISWHVWVTRAPSLPYIRQKENSGNSYDFFFLISGPTPYAFSPPESHLTFVVYMISRDFSCSEDEE